MQYVQNTKVMTNCRTQTENRCRLCEMIYWRRWILLLTMLWRMSKKISWLKCVSSCRSFEAWQFISGNHRRLGTD
ncbi:hypothetical protein F442_14826 [Phytophthora nicotianae P10297]|uniref:Uncharacterized protein n=1 Tax=Phytophthora nicotianae P10297 TaxID=1317064 RepID=W2YQY0_PHYNI|nr:hypothetical protein F442_14826 [Phytophthora nicotianae P10297]